MPPTPNPDPQAVQLQEAVHLVRQLVSVLHPGAVGLIGAHHGEPACERACHAVTAAKAFLYAHDRGQPEQHHKTVMPSANPNVNLMVPVPDGADTDTDAFPGSLTQQGHACSSQGLFRL